MTDIENLDEFVKTLTTQITECIPDDYHLNGDIEVELSIITSKKWGVN